MAIQKINLGTEPLGEGGDTYRSANTKINENFSNTAHAASRLVGTVAGNVAEMVAGRGVAGTGWGTSVISGRVDSGLTPKDLNSGVYVFEDRGDIAPPNMGAYDRLCLVLKRHTYTTGNAIWFPYGANSTGNIVIEQYGGDTRNFYTLYSDKNTKKDSNSNLLLASGDSIPSNSAASKTIGVEKGQVSLNDDLFKASQASISMPTAGASTDANTLEAGDRVYFTSTSVNGPTSSVVIDTYARFKSSRKYQIAYKGGGNRSDFYYRFGGEDGTWSEWATIYSTGNTKLDTNGAVAPSSPTIDLYSDRIETNEDGSRMNPEFVRNGVGDYTIKNTTGLRDEGWYIKIPNDMNGNPKVAVAIDTDKDGNLNIKTYKRTFSLETFTFGPDLEEPLDIPEGRWIDLRFNDLPEEELYEPEPEEEPIVDEADEPVVEEEPIEDEVEVEELEAVEEEPAEEGK